MFTKAILNIVLTCLFVLIRIPAQESIHSIDKHRNKNYSIQVPQQSQFLMKSNSRLNKSVFGFLPYWELASANIRLDLLSHIAIFDFLLTEDGSLLDPPGWPDDWEPVITSAQSSGVKVLMTISNLPVGGVDPDIVTNLINNESAQQLFFNDIKNTIDTYNLDGVILDFEALNIEDRGEPITNFTRELRDSLDVWFESKELSFATPAVNWGSYWNLAQLAETCDYLFIMGYDYHGSWSENAGPVAPLTGNEIYNLVNYGTTIEVDYAGIDPSKLILGVPYYGAQWQTDNSDPYSKVTPKGDSDSNWVGHIDYRNIGWISRPPPNFDPISNTSYFLSTRDRNTYELIWIDSDYSLSLKYDFAIKKNLAGIGMWSLGKDGNYPELWNLIEEKFADSTTSVNDENLTGEFVLHQNYPNPFNPTTSIEYQVASIEKISIRVYDVLGRENKILINEVKSPGNYSVEFDASNLSSGVYFYVLEAGEVRLSKKMLLLR